jgi:predicted transcriptional regulator
MLSGKKLRENPTESHLKKDISQGYLATVLGVVGVCINNIKNGRMNLIFSKVDKISNAMGISSIANF